MEFISGSQLSFAAARRCLSSLLLSLIVAGICCSAALGSAPQIKSYFALTGDNNQPALTPTKSFDCSDKVFSVLELGGFSQGSHHFAVKWIDPAQTVREHTQYQFSVDKTGGTKLWAWLTLSRSPGAELLTWLNPAAGLEEFVGEWDVEISINNRLIAKDSFEVVC